MAKGTTTTVKKVLTEEQTEYYLKVHKETFGELEKTIEEQNRHDKRYEKPFEDDGAYAD
jgi:hypothetical protein